MNRKAVLVKTNMKMTSLMMGGKKRVKQNKRFWTAKDTCQAVLKKRTFRLLMTNLSKKKLPQMMMMRSRTRMTSSQCVKTGMSISIGAITKKRMSTTSQIGSRSQPNNTTHSLCIREKESNGCTICIERRRAAFWETIWDLAKRFRFPRCSRDFLTLKRLGRFWLSFQPHLKFIGKLNCTSGAVTLTTSCSLMTKSARNVNNR